MKLPKTLRRAAALIAKGQTMTKTLIEQPTAAPTRKIKATGIAGLVSAAVLGVLHWWQPELAAMLGGQIEGLIVAIVATLAGYFTREAV